VFNTPLHRPSSLQSPSRSAYDDEYVAPTVAEAKIRKGDPSHLPSYGDRIARNIQGVIDTSLTLALDPGPHIATTQPFIASGMGGKVQENATYHILGSFGAVQSRFCLRRLPKS